jgi:hypothetical protein
MSAIRDQLRRSPPESLRRQPHPIRSRRLILSPTDAAPCPDPLKEGVRVKVVSERPGHSFTVTTLDTYSHVLPSMQEEAAQKVDAMLRQAMDSG